MEQLKEDLKARYVSPFEDSEDICKKINKNMDIVFDDLSLSEVADEYGISRQGVHDLIKRVNNTLNGYEEKLHLVSKFIETKESIISETTK